MSSNPSIRAIRLCSLAIMTIAAVLSFGHQRQLLLNWGVDYLGAAATPITVDLLAIICTLAVHTDGVAAAGRRTAIFVLIVAGMTSMTANFLSGGSLGSKIANVWSVLAYLMAEWIAARVKQATPPAAVDPKRSEAARKAAVTRAANKRRKRARRGNAAPATDVQANAMLMDAGVAPVSPAPR